MGHSLWLLTATLAGAHVAAQDVWITNATLIDAGARVLGIDGRTGTVAVGLEADLLVVDRNPLQDTTTMFEPMLVISDGKVVLDRRDR